VPQRLVEIIISWLKDINPALPEQFDHGIYSAINASFSWYKPITRKIYASGIRYKLSSTHLLMSAVMIES